MSGKYIVLKMRHGHTHSKQSQQNLTTQFQLIYVVVMKLGNTTLSAMIAKNMPRDRGGVGVKRNYKLQTLISV